jgi:hypothetical protein
MKLFAAVMLCMLLVACGGSQTQTKERPLYEGKTGIVASFPETNKLQFYEGDSFSVAIRVENDGATDVTAQNPGWISVLFDPASFHLLFAKTSLKNQPTTPGHYAFALEGRNVNAPVGAIDFFDFTFSANNLQGNRDDAQSTLTFEVCYPYNTTFIQNICVDRDVFEQTATDVCIASAVTGTSQGAPIAVTRVEQSFLRDGTKVIPRFKVTIQNLQNGYTLWNEKESSESVCGQSGFNSNEFGRVKVTALMANQPLKCGTESVPDVARFDHNTAEIICRLDSGVEAGASYETPLIVKLQYFYISTLTAHVEVENVG